MKLFIYPHDEASRGARVLNSELNALRIRHEGSKFQGNPNKVVINWGASKLPDEIGKCRVINKAKFVALTSDKREFFELMSRGNDGPRIPEWTTDLNVALGWIEDKQEVLGRSLTRGSGGEGIVFYDDLQNFTRCRLWTVYKKKKEEYRVHVAFGNVICVQKKVLRQTDDNGQPIDPKTVDFRIRNLANGFIFQRHNLNPDQDVITQALRAFNKNGLDFVAYDVIFNEHEGKAYVLEGNTAPGLEGQTIQDYASAFKTLV